MNEHLVDQSFVIHHLRQCNPSSWWSEVKKLSGKESGSSANTGTLNSLKFIASSNLVPTAFLGKISRLGGGEKGPGWHTKPQIVVLNKLAQNYLFKIYFRHGRHIKVGKY